MPSVMPKSEARVAEMQKRAKRALKQRERELEQQRQKTAKLRALRLEKEAADAKAPKG